MTRPRQVLVSSFVDETGLYKIGSSTDNAINKYFQNKNKTKNIIKIKYFISKVDS